MYDKNIFDDFNSRYIDELIEQSKPLAVLVLNAVSYSFDEFEELIKKYMFDSGLGDIQDVRCRNSTILLDKKGQRKRIIFIQSKGESK